MNQNAAHKLLDCLAREKGVQNLMALASEQLKGRSTILVNASNRIIAYAATEKVSSVRVNDVPVAYFVLMDEHTDFDSSDLQNATVPLQDLCHLILYDMYKNGSAGDKENLSTVFLYLREMKSAAKAAG